MGGRHSGALPTGLVQAACLLTVAGQVRELGQSLRSSGQQEETELIGDRVQGL